MFLNCFFNFSSILFGQSLLQGKHLSFIKLSLTLSYLRKQFQSLHLILRIPCVRLSKRFDNKVTINRALPINFSL